jgi:hypothetical protein
MRVLAAEERISISTLLADQLRQIIRERKGYDRAQKNVL